ncbi:TatD family hydrolase [Solilutibacter tolerans]|uniref:TatD DNase family protein n=1 Tax=Solilutibacter tolerans TaxID=1604334 RepID=A0A1N6XJR6_9GAMM|nr:TatD family hydrolase [Lysobacter tolerans]SIR02584.1 TatD DNase family protein [Lysobacter tolerans]
MRLVDSHSHFDVDAFDVDRIEALARARDAGVVAQIVPAIDAKGWPRLHEVCASDPCLHAAYGLHPVYLPDHEPHHLVTLRERLTSGDGVAVGEIGLDYFLDQLNRDQQQHYFEAQLALAREFELPVIVHARRAVDAVIATLRRFAPVRGVIHSFAGSPEQAEQLYKLGYMLGIGGPVTYDRAQRLRRLVATMPLDYLLLETDSPDQPDAAWRGQRNEPARLPVVLDVIAELRSESREAIAAATTANAERMFGINVS